MPRQKSADAGMNDRQYREHGGTRCPYCEGVDVHPSRKFREDETGTLYRLTRCYGCGREWEEVYELRGWRR